MSGRLVILPHKSWNVWNQDNREKVARDERLHREAEEAKAAKDKLLLQEQNLEILRDGEVSIKLEDSSITTDASSAGHVEPFRLFEDLEKQHYARLGNEDFLKEKAQKELLQKKRDGIADWALGEGSIENSKVKPWYETLGMEGGSASSSKKLDPIKESTRKEKADPMSSILKPNTFEYQPRIKLELTESTELNKLDFLEAAGANLDTIESKESEGSESERSTSKRKRKKSHKDNRKSKSSKHKDREKSERNSEEKKAKHSTDQKVKEESSLHASFNIRKSTTASDPWAELRAKRLEREAIERKRAALLLASVDVYGPGASSAGSSQSRHGYGQQYHPHLARNKR